MLTDEEKHLVKFCQCTFAKYLELLNKDVVEDDSSDGSEEEDDDAS